ncbi:hypothetical protein VTK73DRAFT_2148 [Phialemonium thermophilum]|uniref:C2H2-type domain-containing protein n=1 Tax=Phialemonium thermophilum TaxID=223376 RepID=A0ABR3VSJ7_9PEZI
MGPPWHRTGSSSLGNGSNPETFSLVGHPALSDAVTTSESCLGPSQSFGAGRPASYLAAERAPPRPPSSRAASQHGWAEWDACNPQLGLPSSDFLLPDPPTTWELWGPQHGGGGGGSSSSHAPHPHQWTLSFMEWYFETVHGRAAQQEAPQRVPPVGSTARGDPPRTCRTAPRRRPAQEARTARRQGAAPSEVSCGTCGSSFTGPDRRKILKRHMSTHDDHETLFVCGFVGPDGSACNKEYNREDNLRQHQRAESHAHGREIRRVLRRRMDRRARRRSRATIE